MATSRPAQGNNSNNPFGRPGPAYASDLPLKVVGSGTLSRPSGAPKNGGTRQVGDATPKIVTL